MLGLACFFISDLNEFFEGSLLPIYALMSDDLRTKRKERAQKTCMKEKGDLHGRLFVMRVKISLPSAVVQYLP